MQKTKMRKDEERVCIILNREQKKILGKIAGEERKSFSSILRDGFELYCKKYIEKRKILSDFGL